MLFFIRALILWGAVFGYCTFLKKYMSPWFTPIFTLSAIGVILFLAGLINVMLVSVLLILLGGWACLFLCKPWTKDFFKEHKATFASFGIFSVLCVLFLFRVYEQIPVHYDCYSHWLTVVRDMLKTNQMPSFKSSLISFQGYPTGSAGFIYFICKALGNSRDDLVLFAQAILYAASLTIFGAFIKRRDIVAILIAVAGALFCMSAHTFATDYLLVDTLISLLSIGVVAIIIYYRRDLSTGVLLSLPLQMFLVAVKNSGIIMVAINFTLVMFLSVCDDLTAKKKISLPKLIKLGSITAGIPAVLYYLWMQHVEYVFYAGAVSKHTTSVSNYMATLGEKNTEQIKEILNAFLARFTSWNTGWFLLMITVTVVFCGWLIKKYLLKQNSSSEFFIIFGLVGSYLVFMAVLGAMYLLSMPYDEAIVLAAYERYEKTILVFIIGAVTIYGLTLAELLPGFRNKAWVKIPLLLLMASVLLTQTKNIKLLVQKPDSYVGSSRYDFEQLKSAYAIEEGKSYFVYGTRYQNDAGYHYYMTRYLFWSKDICLCTPEDFETSKEYLKNYDYLIVIDRDDRINQFLESYGLDPQQQVYTVEGIFE